MTINIPIIVNHLEPCSFINFVNSSPNLYDKYDTIKKRRPLEIKLIKTISHLIGLIDSFLYVILTIYIFKNWREIWANPITRVLIIIFIGYIIIYGIGVGNVGTAIRHRSKFVFILIVLAAPKIHKFVFYIKNRIYNK